MAADNTSPVRDRLAHARHDLRTPVNAVLGYGEMLLEDGDDLPAAAQGALRELLGLGKQILQTVNGLLGEEATGGVRVDDLPALRDRLQRELSPPARAVLEHCRRLLATPELGAGADDLRRIHTAGERLLTLLQEPFGAEPAPASNTPAAAELPRSAAPAGAGGGRVLIVDDNDFNRDMLARLLQREGRGYESAAGGEQALAMLRAGSFDLVLLDILMPGLDGFEVLRRLKADPQLRDVPVIMISALDEIAGVVRCIEMGAEDYLPKPFDPVLLRARVGACLEKKRLRDQELDYLRNVALVTEAAAAIEAGAYRPEALAPVAARTDPLGGLARVFVSMAREVKAREDRLKSQVQQLRVEIDEARKAKQVAEITESDYFQGLKGKIEQLRKRTPRQG